MDTFENNYPAESQEPVPSPEVPEAPQPPVEEAPALEPTYRGAGAGRKESPYADSPYVAYQRPQQDYRYQYIPQQEPPKKPKKTKKQGGFWKKAGAAVLALALLLGSNAVTASLVNRRWDKALDETQKQLGQQIQDLQKQIDSASSANSALIGSSVAAGEALTPAQVYAKNVGSVVAISATIQSNGFYGSTESASSGSGFILTQDGYVVTNCHVVEGATSVSIITHDGTEIPAKVVGYDDNNDVAVLKAEAEGLTPVTLGSSDELIIGAARCIENAVDKAGRCYRIGGDEFAAMTNMNTEEAEALLLRLEEQTKQWKGKTLDFAMSIAAGYARAEDFHDLTVEELAKKADQAMYASKAVYYHNR